MNRLHILLDMDGVVADFVSAALSIHGRPELIGDWPVGEWDIAHVLGISRSQFWGQIDQIGFGYWAELAPYSWNNDLLALIKEFGRMTILSSPGMGVEAPKGKILWLRKHVEPGFSNYLFGHQKYLCARPGSVLIDDRDKNVEQFRSHGGNAILFPQVWNANHQFVSDRLGLVREQLQKFSDEQQ